MSVHKLPAETNDLEQAQVRDRATRADLSSEPPPPSDSGSSSETGEDDDDDWNDWVEDDDAASKLCTSLFDDTKHEGLQAAIAYDKEKHGFDIQEFCAAHRLDFYARVRLVNFLRKNRPSPNEVKAYTAKETLFSDDAFLIPIIQDDPYLQMGGEEESDDEAEGAGASGKGKERDLGVEDKDREIQRLKRKLEQAQRDLVDFRQLVEKQFSSSEITAARDEKLNTARPSTSKSTTTALTPKRDDDTHYFNSYGDNGT